MAKPVWQQRLQAKLEADPMCFVPPVVPEGTPIRDIPAPKVKHVRCLAEGDKRGKPITLRLVANYTCFNTCETCGGKVQ